MTNILYISFKKIFNKKTKAFLLILPIAILLATAIIVSSQIQNIQSAVNSNVFESIQNQNTIIQIKKDVQTDPSDPRSFFNVNTNFTETDIANSKSVANISGISMNYSIPVRPIKTTNLIEGKTITFSALNVLDSESASLFTNETFEYSDGTIPIILNAKSFTETIEDWGGLDSISINPRAARGSTPASGTPQTIALGPTKIQNIEYDKSDIIGKEFDITIGGLDTLQSYKIERDESTNNIVFKKLTTDELATQEKTRNESISKYWDYQKISTPQTYHFKVVGLIESESDTKVYVPEDFAKVATDAFVANEVSSRTAEPETSLLGSTYSGLTYNGETLSSGNGRGGFNFRAGGNRMQGQPQMGGGVPQLTQSISYFIPGLVITEDSSGNVTGIDKSASVFDDSIKSSDTVTVKINNLVNRKQVIEDLSKAGFAYQDVSKSEVISSLQSTLSVASNYLSWGFIATVSLVIILALYKFVADSRREIGIFRAMGMKSSTVLVMVLIQGIVSVLLGSVIGIALGVGLNILVASGVSTWFDLNITNSMKALYNITATVPVSVFLNIDWNSAVKYLLVASGIAIIASTFPALKASRMKPVEAIKE
jgi:ABC-type antimicrobial peptide transport system permease subunit